MGSSPLLSPATSKIRKSTRLRSSRGSGLDQFGSARPCRIPLRRIPRRPGRAAGRRRWSRRCFGGAVTLGPDDKEAFPKAPVVLTESARQTTANSNGWITTPRPSARNGGWRSTLRPVIPKTRIPVLFLLHGIGGNEIREWTEAGSGQCHHGQSDRRQEDRAYGRGLP